MAAAKQASTKCCACLTSYAKHVYCRDGGAPAGHNYDNILCPRNLQQMQQAPARRAFAVIVAVLRCKPGRGHPIAHFSMRT